MSARHVLGASFRLRAVWLSRVFLPRQLTLNRLSFHLQVIGKSFIYTCDRLTAVQHLS